MTSPPIITVDGPTGSGKGTISMLLAQRLGWHFLDSGSLYRVLALAVMRGGIGLEDEAALGEMAANLPVTFLIQDDLSTIIQLDDEDITDEIRTEECSIAASKVSKVPAVRQALLKRQRAFHKPPGLVADGRDMGTVVFPEAKCKFFLTASPEERAQRRYNQLKEKGINVSLAAIFDDLIERDTRDEQRELSPLKPADDAILIDTTALSIDEVMQQVMKHVAPLF